MVNRDTCGTMMSCWRSSETIKSSEYIFELDSFMSRCSRFDENGIETYHNDHLGTPRELTDENGQVVWSSEYDVYGISNQLHRVKSENQIRFQGQYEDYETGLHYNFYRYYDPTNGKYISQDPIGLCGGGNQYSYTPNPINWVDPLGLEACPQLYARYKILRAKGFTPAEAAFVARNGRYTAASRAHLKGQQHHARSQPKQGKGRFLPREGGQKFTDEIIYHPNTKWTRQPKDNRFRFDNSDLGRNVGYDTDNNTLVRGGRVVLEREVPWSGSPYGPGNAVTQFPQKWP